MGGWFRARVPLEFQRNKKLYTYSLIVFALSMLFIGDLWRLMEIYGDYRGVEAIH